MNVGILTGGGDCAGLNAVIRAAVKRAEEYGFKVTEIRYGWSGLIKPDTVPLTFKQVSNIHFLCVKAVDLIREEKYGMMVALKGTKVVQYQ